MKKNMKSIIDRYPGYERFIDAWIRAKLPLYTMPTQDEWEKGFESQYIYSQDPYKESELLKIFPEALPVIKENIEILKKYQKHLEKILKIELENIYTKVYKVFLNKDLVKDMPPSILTEFVTQEFYNKPLSIITQKIKKLERYLIAYEWKDRKNSKNGITPADVMRAKQYPLDQLETVPERGGFVNCPFHKEKTPSLKIYREQNRWHCFGCNEGGDVIDFVIKRDNLTFIDAVRYLLSR